jgi:hypothetical protein
MKVIQLSLHAEGDFLGDGDIANRLRFSEVEPLFAMQDQVIFDFSGIANITDSFANGLVGNLVELHPVGFFEKVKFRHCTPLVRSVLLTAIELGRRRAERATRR